MGLEALLGRSVDVVTDKGFRERMRERVIGDAIPLSPGEPITGRGPSCST